MAITTKSLGILLAITLAVLLSVCSATVYTVGDSKGWSSEYEAVYDSWAEGKEFHVGDSLVFDYEGKVNDVTQVGDALEYEFCRSSSPKAVYKSGHDVVTFTEPGYHYFITSNHDECLRGNKLQVLVVSDVIPPPLRYNAAHLPSGEIFRVGQGRGWRVPEEDDDFYSKWSLRRQFNVGDNLLFQYDKAREDVFEISSGLGFKSCDSTSSLVSVHKTGHDLVTLTKPGIHYFISSNPGHCFHGLKLRVMVRPTVTSLPKTMDW